MTKHENVTCLKRCILIATGLCFLGVGLSLALTGPTLPTLASNLEVSVSDLAYVIPVRSVGYLTGSILGGIVFEKMNSFVFLALSMMICSAGLFVVPFCPSPISLAGVLSAGGISMGLLDTGGTVLVLQLWGGSSGSYLQAVHFFFAVGAMLAPILANPFIKDFNNTELTLDSGAFLHNASKAPNYDLKANETMPDEAGFPEVAYVYIISGVYCFMISLIFCYFAVFSKSLLKMSEQQNTIEAEGIRFRMQMISMLFIFFALYVGMEVCFGIYIFTFSSLHLQYSKEQASALNTVFWGGFCIGRFFAIFAAKVLSITSLFQLDLVGGVFFSIALLFIVQFNWAYELALVATGGFGTFIACIFPSGIAWGEQYITINGRMASVLVVGGALGEMLFPFLVGLTIESAPRTFIYIITGTSGASAILYIMMQVFASQKGKRIQKQLPIELDTVEKTDKLLDDFPSMKES